MDPNLNIKFTYVSYTSYTQGLKFILYKIFHNFVHETKCHGVEFSNYGTMSMLKNFDFGALPIWDSQTEVAKSFHKWK
jgi:hypothetical protein